ncbi:hypothetical protein KBI23_19065 [bacterium]|nr:hypothetical protein [bacterium]MBP9807648.1 hypothetical protein [bacterium]
MPDEKQAPEPARFVKVESTFNNGAIEKATNELRLETYKQIQNCFLGLCMFFGLITLLMQQTDLHKQMTLVRQTLLRAPEDAHTISRLAALNTQLDQMPEAELLYKPNQALIKKYNQAPDESSAHAR